MPVHPVSHHTNCFSHGKCCHNSAAPLVLAHAGLLHGRRATIYPGMAAHLGDAIYEEKLVVEDGLITTAEGPAAVLPYSYRLVSYFRGDEAAQSIAKGMVYDRLLREG